MEESGKYIIQQVPKTAEFHSVIMTTFSFDFHYFESQILRLLKQKGITSFNILVDTNMLDKSIGFSTGHLKAICNHYSVNSIPCTGAFHPKIIFLVGKNDVMFIQGSGNITTGGHGKNHELFSAYYANTEDQTQLPIIQETWNYLKSITVSIKGIGATKINRVEQQCDLLNKIKPIAHSWNKISKNYSVAAVYNEQSSIWNQVIDLLPKKGIKEIKVFSPFYDENGTLLSRFASQYNCSIKAFMQPDKGIHPYKMTTNSHIQFLSWESTLRSTVTTKKYIRKLHSKIFWFDTGDAQYCLLGSPNCTIRAFGTEKSRGANDEFALLVKLKDQSWISKLGLDGDYVSIIPQSNDIIREIEKNLENEQDKNSRKVKLLGVDQNDEILTIYIANFNKIKEAKLVVFNQWAEVLENFKIKFNKDKIELKLKAKNHKAVAFVEIFNSVGESISNKQIVNTFFNLWNSDPSQENRDLIKLGSKIEMGNNNLYDVIDFFNTIQTKRTTKKHKFNDSNFINNLKINKTNNSLASLTYEEACALDYSNSENQKILRQHHAIQIFDAIEKRFRDLLREEEEEDMDDEEDMKSATSGRKRKDKKDYTAPEYLNSIKVIKKNRKKIIDFLGYYEKSLDKAINIKNHFIGLVDLAMYLIVLNNLIDFAEREVILKVHEKDEENTKHVLFPVQGSYKELSSFNSAILNLVGKFITLLNQSSFQETTDHYSQDKLEKYKLLCRRTTLFTLATMRSKYDDSDQLSDWYNIMAYNIQKHFGKLELGYERFLENYERNISLNHFSIEKTKYVLNCWDKDFNEISNSSNLYDSKYYGICRIIKTVPKEAKAKFYLLARPGFHYTDKYKDFVLSQFYNIKTGKLLSSLQEFKKNQLFL